MSAQFTSLHPYVSQRLLSLFETLAKKHTRLEARIRAEIPTREESVINLTVNVTTVNGITNTDTYVTTSVNLVNTRDIWTK